MSLITTSPVLDVSNHVYVQSPRAFSAWDWNVPEQCRHIGFTLAFFFSSSPRLLPTVARWMFSLPEKGTTSAAFTTEVFFFLFFKSTSCEWSLQQRCSLVHAYPLCMVLYRESVCWSPYLSCIINPKSFLFNLVRLNSSYLNKDYLKRKKDSFKRSYKSPFRIPPPCSF